MLTWMEKERMLPIPTFLKQREREREEEVTAAHPHFLRKQREEANAAHPHCSEKQGEGCAPSLLKDRET